ncbi:MAG: hypothetical protein ABIS86_24165 [Streptosporangiaceae bacterium]
MVALNAGAGTGRRVPAVLGVATVLLGGFAFWAHQQEAQLYDTDAGRNSALADGARTSEVKGQIVEAVNKAFTYDYQDLARTDRAAHSALTGPAIKQYNVLFGQIKTEAADRKLILTTKVTEASVTYLHGDAARLLVFADQYNNQGADGQEAYVTTMLAVDAVRRDDQWKIAGLDTFTGRS